MDSIAKNEFIVINFLVRNFSERLTIRNIAAKLKLSAAGVHSILKKLENSKIVEAEKLGTGLFYRIGFNSPTARHLAAVVLLDFYKNDVPREICELKKDVGAAVLQDNNLLLVTSLPTEPLKGFNVVALSSEELVNKLRDKDKEILDIIKEGIAVFGEDMVVNAIKEAVR